MAFVGSLNVEERKLLAAYCSQIAPAQCLDYQAWGNTVLRYDTHRVVKFGRMVSADEAWNQASVSQMVDQQVVRVPRVHEWFQDECGLGYLVMDYMEGERADQLQEDAHGEQLRKILNHLHSFTSEVIGPIHSDCHRSILFGEGACPTLSSADQVMEWFSRRFLDEDSELSIKDFDLVLCHMDLTCRNLLWSDDQPPCLLDWEHAGFYPRFFEKCSQEVLRGPADGGIVAAMPLTDIEESQFCLIMKAFANEMRYCFDAPLATSEQVRELLAIDASVPVPPLPRPPTSV